MAVTVASFHSHSLSSTDCVVTLADVRDAGKSDPNYKALLNLIESGFPSTRSSTDPALREFWEVRHRLSSQDGVAFMGTRTIIPSQLRKLTLERLHGAHQGVSSMKRRANTSVYWPGLSSAIVNRRKNCMGCEENGPSQPAEPLIPTKSPEWPFQMICMDYFTLESYSYLVTVDRFSGWPCVYHMKNGDANSTVLIKICRELFTTYGVPDEISSDGGPQFKAHEFSNFLETWGIHHRKSSAEYPQSNGRAEVGVKTMKRIIRDNTSSNGDLNNDKVLAAILQYKNTPLPDVDLSPAQILFHRNLKDSIPSHPAHYHLHRDWVVSAEQREAQFARRNKVVATRYNAHTRLLRELSVGTHVLIQSRNKKWNRLGVIVEKLDNRQYNIKVKGSGRVTLRNRRFIKPCSYVQPHQNQIITPPKQHQQLIPTVIDTRVDSPSQHVTPAQVMQPPPHPVDLPVDRGEVENNTTTTDNNDLTSSESNILTNGGGEKMVLRAYVPAFGTLPPRIQNQSGNHPKRWDRSGTIVDSVGHDSYLVKVDGSGRVTQRNRRFLRQFVPVSPSFPSPPKAPSTIASKPQDTYRDAAPSLPLPTAIPDTPSAVPAATTFTPSTEPPNEDNTTFTPSEEGLQNMGEPRPRRSARAPLRYEPETGKWV